jgi:hypothetical protein
MVKSKEIPSAIPGIGTVVLISVTSPEKLEILDGL